MRNYGSLVATEILLLLAVVVFVSPRGRAVYYTLLGQTHLIHGEPSPFAAPGGRPPAQGALRFTSVGLIVMALLATKTAKGAWGAAVAFFLAALLVSLFLLNYRQFLSFVVTDKPTH